MTKDIQKQVEEIILQCKDKAYGNNGRNASNVREGDFGDWRDWKSVLVGLATTAEQRGYRKGWDAAMVSVPNPNYSQEEIQKAEQRGAEKERERYQETIKELLEWLPDSNNYEYCWEDCTSKEQDKVKEIRQKYQSLQREGRDKE